MIRKISRRIKIMPLITVLIADHDEARRAACARLLQPAKGIRVVGPAQGGLEDLASIAKLKPGILLLSLNSLENDKIAQLLVLRQKSPRTKVILLTRRAPEARILDALSCGARGYVEEEALRTFLAKAVRCVNAGEAWVPHKMVVRIIERLACLTARE
jgi:DNA-binding NarL/FixJ family response regulator